MDDGQSTYSSNRRFVKHPEFLKVGQRLVFREGRTKAVGNVTKIVPHIPLAAAAGGITSRGAHMKNQQKMTGRGQGQRKKEDEVLTPQQPSVAPMVS